nr:MAG TPA: hypothetical protein [Crassvirales sp.]
MKFPFLFKKNIPLTPVLNYVNHCFGNILAA